MCEMGVKARQLLLGRAVGLAGGLRRWHRSWPGVFLAVGEGAGIMAVGGRGAGGPSAEGHVASVAVCLCDVGLGGWGGALL